MHLQSAHLQGSPFLPQPQSGDCNHDYIRDGDQDGDQDGDHTRDGDQDG